MEEKLLPLHMYASGIVYKENQLSSTPLTTDSKHTVLGFRDHMPLRLETTALQVRVV